MLAVTVMVTDPPAPMVFVGAEALSQFPPDWVVDEMVNVVAAVPELVSVEVVVAGVLDPEPFDSDTVEGLTVRLAAALAIPAPRVKGKITVISLTSGRRALRFLKHLG